MQIDPRGPRFGALITTIVLVIGLILGASHPAAAAILIAAQAVVFAIGAALGLRAAPYGLIYKALVRPRLGPPAELEDEAPPRFAQAVGLAFALIAIAGYASGVTALGVVAAGAALVAAFLNAAFALCLGCEMYLLIKRLAPASRASLGS